MKIFKYPIDMKGVLVEIAMHDPATIVHVAEDPTSLTPTIWALADESKPVKLHDVIVVGTGSEIPRAPFAHIGTAICGSFVWHVFSDSLRKVGE